MLLTITNEGITAINVAMINDTKITVASMQFCDTNTFTATAAYVGNNLPGNTVYSGAIDSSTLQADGLTINYVKSLGNTVGTFTIGGVGLYLSDGTLFAYGPLSALVIKTIQNLGAGELG